MRKTLALILALVLALSCMGFAVAEPVAEQVEEAVAEIEEVAIGAAAEEVAPEEPVIEEAPVEEVVEEEPAFADEVAPVTANKVGARYVYQASDFTNGVCTDTDGHVWEEEKAYTIDSTCTTHGGKYVVCSKKDCGAEARIGDELPFLGARTTDKNGNEVAYGLSKVPTYKDASGNDVAIYNEYGRHEGTRNAEGARNDEVYYKESCKWDEHSTVGKCVFCGKTGVANTTKEDGTAYTGKQLKHDYTKQIKIIEEPTCTKPGKALYKCPNHPEGKDYDSDRTIEKEITLDHTWVTWFAKDSDKPEGYDTDQPFEDPNNSRAPTCLKGGWKLKDDVTELTYCKNCFAVKRGDENKVIAVDKLNHADIMDRYFKVVNKSNEAQYTIQKKLVDSYTDADIEKWVIGTDDVVTYDSANNVLVNGKYLILGAKNADDKSTDDTKDEDGNTVIHLKAYEEKFEGANLIKAHYGPVDITFKPATCEEAGFLTVKCLDCGAVVTKETPAMGHEFKYLEKNSEKEIPDGKYDCTKVDYVEKIECVRCKDQKISGYFTKHEYSDTAKYAFIVPGTNEEAEVDSLNDVPLCLEYEERYYCTHVVGISATTGQPITCREHKKVAKKARSEHEWETYDDLVITATCTEPGYEYYYCYYCKAVISKSVAALGHYADPATVKIAKQPTCTETGLRTFDCKRCGEKAVEKLNEVIPALDHNYVETYIEGVTVRFPVLDEHGHQKTNADGSLQWTYNDCKQDGVIAYKCTRCDATTSKVVKHKHVWAEPLPAKGTHYKPATCTKDGFITAYCTQCKQTINAFTIDKLGHERSREDYDHDKAIKAGKAATTDVLHDGVWYTGYVPATCANAAYYWYSCTCDECDAADGKVPTKSGTKTVKHLVKVEVGSKIADAHMLAYSGDVAKDVGLYGLMSTTQKIKGIVITKMPTCEAEGYMYYICDLCKKTVGQTLPKLPHNYKVVWSTDQKKYVQQCAKIPTSSITKSGDTYTLNVADNAKYVEGLRDNTIYAFDAVYNKLLERWLEVSEAAKSKTLLGVGGETSDAPIEKLTYKVTKVSDSVLKVAKESDTQSGHWPVLYVSWQYTLPDGSNFSYVKTFETYKINETALDKKTGDYQKLDEGLGKAGVNIRIGNPQPSADWKLDTIVAIVCDDVELETKSQHEANHLDIGHAVFQMK